MLAPIIIKSTPRDRRVIEELHSDQLANIQASKEGAHYDEECCTVDARFCLSPGTYATVFLGEYLDLREAS